QPTDYVDGLDYAGPVGGATANTGPASDDIAGINLGAGVAAVNNNFTETLLGSISGHVYVVNGDGSHTALSNVQLDLYGRSGKVTSVTSSADGSYSFAGLSPDTYTVVENQPDGYDDGPDYAGTVNGVAVGAPDADVGDDNLAGISLPAGGVGVNYD